MRSTDEWRRALVSLFRRRCFGMCWHPSYSNSLTVGWWQLHRPVLLVMLLVVMRCSDLPLELRAVAQPVNARSPDVWSIDDQDMKSQWIELAPIPNPLGVAGLLRGLWRELRGFRGGKFPRGSSLARRTQKLDECDLLNESRIHPMATVPSLIAPWVMVFRFHGTESLFCIGGCDSQHHSSKCYRIGWDGKGLTKTSLPDLQSLVLTRVVRWWEPNCFVAGGLEAPDSSSPMKSVWMLDFERERLEWVEIPAWAGA